MFLEKVCSAPRLLLGPVILAADALKYSPPIQHGSKIMSSIMTLTTLSLLLLAHSIAAHPTSRTLSVTNSSKAGIAGGGDASTDMTQFTTTGKVSWYYTWGLSSVDTELEFVPMLWGQKEVAQWSDTSDGINATITQRKPTAVLGMNECVNHLLCGQQKNKLTATQTTGNGAIESHSTAGGRHVEDLHRTSTRSGSAPRQPRAVQRAVREDLAPGFPDSL